MKSQKRISPAFFDRKTLTVARELIGATLVRKLDGVTKRYKITELEAYVGPHDLACHAAKGRTKRTEVMFGHPGYLYIYFIYGMYWMLNVVTEKKDYPAAILIRGLEDEDGIRISGPGRLTKALGITGALNGSPAHVKSSLWFEFRGEKVKLGKIKKTPRIGVDYAGPVWSKKHYRFLLLNK